MEKRLQERLGELEYKPSGSLWDRIEMQSNEGFETGLIRRLEKYELPPDPETWERIEAELPIAQPASARSGRMLLLSLLLFISSVSAITYFVMNQPAVETPMLAQQAVAPKPESTLASAPLAAIAQSQTLPETPRPARLNSSTPPPHSPLHRNSVHSRLRDLQESESSDAIASNEPNPPVKTFPPALVHDATEHIGSEPTMVENSSVIRVTHADEQQAPEPVTTPLVKGNEPVQKPQLLASTSDSMTQVLASQASHRTSHDFDEEPGPISISVITGAAYCFAQLEAPSGSGDKFTSNIALRKQLERPGIDWSGTFMVDYRFNERWMISGGLGILNFSQEFTYNLTSPVKGSASTKEQNAVVVNATDSIVSGSANATRIKYSWTEFPIWLSYTLTPSKSRWGFSLKGGFSYAQLSTTDAGMVNYDNIGILIIRDENAFPKLQNSFFVNFNPAISWQLNPTVGLSLMPTFRYSLNSMVNNNQWVSQQPWMIGLSGALCKRF